MGTKCANGCDTRSCRARRPKFTLTQSSWPCGLAVRLKKEQAKLTVPSTNGDELRVELSQLSRIMRITLCNRLFEVCTRESRRSSDLRRRVKGFAGRRRP